MLNSINGVNVGLMTYNERQGGHVDYALEDVATARANVDYQVGRFCNPGARAAGGNPLRSIPSNGGRGPVYGDVGSDRKRSPPIARPPRATCPRSRKVARRNFIVYLS